MLDLVYKVMRRYQLVALEATETQLRGLRDQLNGCDLDERQKALLAAVENMLSSGSRFRTAETDQQLAEEELTRADEVISAVLECCLAPEKERRLEGLSIECARVLLAYSKARLGILSVDMRNTKEAAE